jgi:DNA-binding NarL/FixJ family response regulator
MKTGLTSKLACPISTLIIDDCLEFRHGLKHLLDFYNTTGSLHFQIVGQATALAPAIEAAIEQSPKLILLDMELSDSNGIEVLQQLQNRSHPSYVLVLSGHEDAEWIFKAMQAGARGYLFKHQLSSQLFTAIEMVLSDYIYLCPEATTRFFQHFHFATGRSTFSNSGIHLTEREREVLYWLVQGASNEVIAQQLYITIGTVKAYLTTIFEKLGVHSRTQAALQALKLGLVKV